MKTNRLNFHNTPDDLNHLSAKRALKMPGGRSNDLIQELIHLQLIKYVKYFMPVSTLDNFGSSSINFNLNYNLKIMENKHLEFSSRMQNSKLIMALINCALTCEDCATQCLHENSSSMSRCIELDRDCSDICFQTARLLARGSDVGSASLMLCEEICRMCAEECNKHEMQHCQACASICNQCAESCHEHHGRVFLT
jgi:hypothetical protein